MGLQSPTNDIQSPKVIDGIKDARHRLSVEGTLRTCEEMDEIHQLDPCATGRKWSVVDDFLADHFFLVGDLLETSVVWNADGVFLPEVSHPAENSRMMCR